MSRMFWELEGVGKGTGCEHTRGGVCKDFLGELMPYTSRKVGIKGDREEFLRRQSEQRLEDKEGSMCRKLWSTSVPPQLEGTDGEGVGAGDLLAMLRSKARTFAFGDRETGNFKLG